MIKVGVATRGLVLVVDDEAFPRLAAIDICEEAGLETIEATGAEALRLLESRSDVRVLLTDVNMRGSTEGLRLAHAVRDRWPTIGIIVVSGQHALRPGELPTRALFFPKPLSQDNVVAALLAFTEPG